MDVQSKKKNIRQKKWQEKQLWLWRVGQRSAASQVVYRRYFDLLAQSWNKESLSKEKRKSLQNKITRASTDVLQSQPNFMKYVRRMRRYSKKGQLRNGTFVCKIGKPITQTRLDHYEAMCHYMVRKFLPACALWEASYAYEDLVGQCRMEVMLALLNGYDPYKVLEKRERTEEELVQELQKLEQGIVYGRLKDYLRRTRWKFHPDQLGGKTWCLDQIITPGSGNSAISERSGSHEFEHGLYNENLNDPLFSIDVLKQHTDHLLDILKKSGPEAAKSEFEKLDPVFKDRIGDSLFQASKSRWSNLPELMEEEECDSELS